VAGDRVIAIDGPAGSGKSTVAQAVARKLGVAYLDTGAMYRSVTHVALQRGVDVTDGDALAGLARELEIEVGDRVLVDGDDVSEAIRTPAVNGAVSTVAAHPEVRTELVRRQKAWAATHQGGVMEGRDIGTVVCPNARLKVFLTAGEDERARRRNDEADVEQRDRLDSTRAVSPLKPADDAVVIDTTELTVDEVVTRILERL
jgi:cytidylate kinase